MVLVKQTGLTIFSQQILEIVQVEMSAFPVLCHRHEEAYQEKDDDQYDEDEGIL